MLKNKHIVTKISVLSILLFYFPSLVIILLYINIFKNQKIEIYFIIGILFIWLPGIICFILFLRHHLIIPINGFIKKVKNILNGDYDKKIAIKSTNELGLIDEKLNDLAYFIKQKDLNFKKRIISKTKELQDEIECIKKYNNQITDVFMSLTHDIKNPLTVIGGYTNLILQNEENFNEEKKKELTRRVELEIDRLIKIIKDFLKTLSKEENLDKMAFDKINIKDILKYFYNIYEIKAKEKKVDFILDVKDDLPYVWGNHVKLEFVVSNLLSNAFKFVLTNGFVKIETFVENNFIKVSVTNTSLGIENYEEEIIFEKYKKIHNHIPDDDGIGLGLYIAKTIIQKHNGDIGVKINEQEKSITFYFRVPLVKE